MSSSWLEPSFACNCICWFQGPSPKGSKSKLMVACSRRPSGPSPGKGSEMEVRLVGGAGPPGATFNRTEFYVQISFLICT